MICLNSRHRHQQHHLIIFIIAICGFTITTTNAAFLPANVEFIDARDAYSSIPNEIVPIQPILVYPKSRNALPYQGRNLLRDNDIIYVKLLDRKSYRPSKQRQLSDESPNDIPMKDIFYVKAPTNGQFSTSRLKVYRMPEFYAISVYKKSDLTQ